ncbi:serine/threonine protein kinase [Pannonibacter tanglangensis]|uniref:Serine/threonine protein kinase n=1 Tax=Pannonibacter tanglangensis TaxID=2750084 RepID=A0ABW9ZJC3_9HYPH|nr:serine/threonine protein kinase [Pannonibacter sp. XCT-34]
MTDTRLPSPDGPCHHATAVILGRFGLLLRGPSGAGKSSLALHLLGEAERNGHFAALVGDDRVHLSVGAAGLVAEGARGLEGRIELRGHGLIRRIRETQALIHLVIDLRPIGEIERLPDDAACAVPFGPVQLPCQAVPEADLPRQLLLVRHALLRLAGEGACPL